MKLRLRITSCSRVKTWNGLVATTCFPSTVFIFSWKSPQRVKLWSEMMYLLYSSCLYIVVSRLIDGCFCYPEIQKHFGSHGNETDLCFCCLTDNLSPEAGNVQLGFFLKICSHLGSKMAENNKYTERCKGVLAPC